MHERGKMQVFPFPLPLEGEAVLENDFAVRRHRPGGQQFADDKVMVQAFAPVFASGNLVGEVVLIERDISARPLSL